MAPDYDIFAIFWTIDKGIKVYQPPVPTNSYFRRRSNSFSSSSIYSKSSELSESFKKGKSRGLLEIEDDNLGNVSPEMRDFLDEFIKYLGYENGIIDSLSPIRHGTEMFNPYMAGFIDPMYTCFLPNTHLLDDFKINGERVIESTEAEIFYFIFDNIKKESKECFKALFTHFQEKGYYVPKNCFSEETSSFGLTKTESNFWILQEIERLKQQLQSRFQVEQVQEELSDFHEEQNEEGEDLSLWEEDKGFFGEPWVLEEES